MDRATRIMIVEDLNITALDLKNRLRKMGYEVAALAGSGEEAIQKAEQVRPDLILMDIRLKGEMDGVEAAERIRQKLDIPVIYLTAHADDSTLQRAMETRPYGYVLKPFGEKELRITIEMALHRHREESKLRDQAGTPAQVQ
ncbi:MAG: response regulator [bacterium]|nr:response regulator [candidate division KSB1 bacterium]MDH7559367.1 response regulator [bacterium]